MNVENHMGCTEGCLSSTHMTLLGPNGLDVEFKVKLWYWFLL